MSASLSGVFNLQEFTDLGVLGAGMRLYTYEPATTTQKVAFTDPAGTIPHTYTADGQGGEFVALNSRGELPAPLFLAAGGYDITLKTPAGVTVWTRRAIGGSDAAAAALTQLASQTDVALGAGMVGAASNLDYPAGTVGDRFREYVSITEPRFGGISGGSWHAAINAATAYCNSRDIAGDTVGPDGGVCLVIPRDTFPITAAVNLPRNVICYGEITGAFDVKITQLKRCSYVGLRCDQTVIDGMWFGSVNNCRLGTLTIKGGGTNFGTFWNVFDNLIANVTIDLSNWSVNQNRFSGRGGFTTVGTTGTLLDGHGNNVSNWDFTGGECSNTSTIQQDSLLTGVYYEAGADIAGPYHVIGAQGDADGPPMVNRRNHVLAMFDVVEKNRADFLAAGSRSILQGGEWDFLDAAGKPPCITSSGGNTVAADATEPFGMKYKYGGAFTLAFTGFQITVPPCRSGRFSLCLAYQGDDFAAVEVARGGGGTTTSGGASVVTIDSVNNWKLLRLSGNASQTANTTVNLFALTAGGAKTINIGGMFASQEKAALLPSAQIVREQQGTAVQAYTNVGTSVDVSVTFSRPFATGTTPNVIFSVVNTAAQTPNLTKALLQSVSETGFTVRVYFATDWAGQINWNARGLD